LATTEPTINDALAGILRKTRRVWRDYSVVKSENTGVFKDKAKQPDILIVELNVSPVVIETEVFPATTVESEARGRLGEKLIETGRPILSSIAVRLPYRLRKKSGEALKRDLLDSIDFEMAIFTGRSSENWSRWPQNGWVQGNLSDLSILVQSASVPPAIIEEATEWLVSGVSEAASLMGEMASRHVGTMQTICWELKQEDGEQTRRMASTILANAFVFQENLARGPGDLADVKTIDELRNDSGIIGKSEILKEWKKILKVNYWPIFDIAYRILKVIPVGFSKELIDKLAATAHRLLENRLTRSHDLTGAVFQRLIADRKFLAAFYTTPASAALLTGLAISSDITPAGESWSDAEKLKGLRFADFACGTGTLLSTVYQRIGQYHELAGGDAEALHPSMMASTLVGCDILPSASHLTASMLAGAHPTTKYNQSSIMTVAYGRQPDDTVTLGSLDLLDPQGKFEVLSITATAAESMGKKERNIWLSLPHSTFDLVIMNPPFTRATGHEGKKVGVPNPMFAAFNSTKEEQQAMSKATQRLTSGTSAHGNAGEASIFLVLADKKLKVDGTVALVMPLSLVSGDAWEMSRQLLRKYYNDLIIVSISGSSGKPLSFSADTGMGECLVVGRKLVSFKERVQFDKSGESSKEKRAVFVILKDTPTFPMMGAAAAVKIRRVINSGKIRRIEDGPVGGTSISFGDDTIGHLIDAPFPLEGGWNLARVSDIALSQAAYQLCEQKRIWLPGMNESDTKKVPIATVNDIGQIGPYHMDVSGNTPNGGIRGPFEISKVTEDEVPTYPIIWAHDANRERTMLFEADSEGIIRQGANENEESMIREKVARVWETASHCHFNRDFQFNSQSTAMQFTDRLTIGGRAWLSIRLENLELEKALTVWANSSIGMLLYWWHANKQQVGRGNIGKMALQKLKILDITALNTKKLDAAITIFDDLSKKKLLPLNEIDKDPNRRELDERFMKEVLDMPEYFVSDDGPLGILRAKLAREPSIRGHKSI
jgi:hypothetical protein